AVGRGVAREPEKRKTPPESCTPYLKLPPLIYFSHALSEAATGYPNLPRRKRNFRKPCESSSSHLKSVRAIRRSNIVPRFPVGRGTFGYLARLPSKVSAPGVRALTFAQRPRASGRARNLARLGRTSREALEASRGYDVFEVESALNNASTLSQPASWRA